MTYDVHALRRAEFPWADRGEAIFLDHASTGPLPERTRRVIAEHGLKRAEPHRLQNDDFFPVLAEARANAERLIGAPKGTVALMTNTSHGVNLAARSLPYGAGDVILSTHGEFPANVYPWMAACKDRGAEFRLLPAIDGIPDDAGLLHAIAHEPRAKGVAISWVNFWSGHRFDLAAIGAACKARGLWLFVDAIQGLGPLTLDLSALGIDMLSCGAQKWLLSPWGVGFTYVRPELVTALEPKEVGWMAQPASADFGRFLSYDATYWDDARRFEVVTLDFVHFHAMAASLSLFLDVGPAAAAAHVKGLTDAAIAAADARGDLTVATPRADARRAGIVALRSADVAASSARLRAATVSHSVREGAVRLAPHLYNTVDEIERAVALL